MEINLMRRATAAQERSESGDKSSASSSSSSPCVIHHKHKETPPLKIIIQYSRSVSLSRSSRHANEPSLPCASSSSSSPCPFSLIPPARFERGLPLLLSAQLEDILGSSPICEIRSTCSDMPGTCRRAQLFTPPPRWSFMRIRHRLGNPTAIPCHTLSTAR